MALSITHTFVSGVADGGNAALVQPSNWNAALTTSMATGKILLRTTASAGAIEEGAAGPGLTLSALSLRAQGKTNATHMGWAMP